MATRASLYQFFVNFDLDRYTNPYVPRSRLAQLPRPITHFLGYRPQLSKEPPALVQWISMIVATIAGLCVVSATFVYAPGLAKYNPPVIIASLGASAVLDYNTIRSPLAQPRNTVIGHTLSAIVGVAIAKLFQLSDNFQNVNWVSGAVACALASLVMSLTGTIHPPGGATAVLASTQSQIVAMGWWFVPFVLLASCEMLGVALLVNNICRQYPMYWWTASECGQKLSNHKKPDEEKAVGQADTERENSDSGDTESAGTLEKKFTNDFELVSDASDIHILSDKIQVPTHIHISDEEAVLLEGLQEKLQAYKRLN